MSAPCLCGDTQCVRCFPVGSYRYLADMEKAQLNRITATAQLRLQYAEHDSIVDQDTDTELAARADKVTRDLWEACESWRGLYPTDYIQREYFNALQHTCLRA